MRHIRVQSFCSGTPCVDRELLFTRPCADRDCFDAGQGRHHRGHRGGVPGAAGHAGVPGDVPVPPAAAAGVCCARGQAVHRRLSGAATKPDMKTESNTVASIGGRHSRRRMTSADTFLAIQEGRSHTDDHSTGLQGLFRRLHNYC